VEERAVAAGSWDLAQLLTTVGLADSKGEARRLIQQGGVRLGGERQSSPGAVVKIDPGDVALLQVGKRRFLRVRGE